MWKNSKARFNPWCDAKNGEPDINRMPNNEMPQSKKMEEQIAEMARDIHKIKRRLLIMAIGSYARLVILLVPLIFAAVYLPPLLREFWHAYGPLLQGVGGASGSGPQEIFSHIDSAQIDALLKQFSE